LIAGQAVVDPAEPHVVVRRVLRQRLGLLYDGLLKPIEGRQNLWHSRGWDGAHSNASTALMTCSPVMTRGSTSVRRQARSSCPAKLPGRRSRARSRKLRLTT